MGLLLYSTSSPTDTSPAISFVSQSLHFTSLHVLCHAMPANHPTVHFILASKLMHDLLFLSARQKAADEAASQPDVSLPPPRQDKLKSPRPSLHLPPLIIKS